MNDDARRQDEQELQVLLGMAPPPGREVDLERLEAMSQIEPRPTEVPLRPGVVGADPPEWVTD